MGKVVSLENYRTNNHNFSSEPLQSISESGDEVCIFDLSDPHIISLPMNRIKKPPPDLTDLSWQEHLEACRFLDSIPDFRLNHKALESVRRFIVIPPNMIGLNPALIVSVERPTFYHI